MRKFNENNKKKHTHIKRNGGKNQQNSMGFYGQCPRSNNSKLHLIGESLSKS